MDNLRDSEERKVPNEPVSTNAAIGALVPALQASALRAALDNAGIEDVDQFVMDELQYADRDDFRAAFSAEAIHLGDVQRAEEMSLPVGPDRP